MAGDNSWGTIRRRYLSLGLGEFVAAMVFAVVAFTVALPKLGDRSLVPLTFALVPLLVILVQAGSYWLLALAWAGRGSMSGRVATIYQTFRWVDVALLGVGLLGILIWRPDGAGALVIVVLIWLFGLAEYVNYFIARLAYPPHRWAALVGQWRTPRLMLDIRRVQRQRTLGDQQSAG